jgi:predicted  nucleic acid-binding Zn-ribbon protein
MTEGEERTSGPNPDVEVIKPLPSLPENEVPENAVNTPMQGPASPSRPRMHQSLSSFHKQRRKVVWKGKNCIISLPITDRESAGLPPILSPTAVREKLADLLSQGYSTKGFELTDVDGVSATFTNGQSAAPFPDPAEMSSERQMRSFKVYIPDQSEWQKWVDYLQEEKLRALGVTLSDSEPPQSGPSPLSASLSRASSRFLGASSPPVGTSSAASNTGRVASNPFSPPFSVSSGRGSTLGSGASSQVNGFPGSIHAHKSSLAFPPGQNRVVSPNEFVPGQTSPFLPGLNAHMRRPTSFSPINAHGIQSLDQVLSPVGGHSDGHPQPIQSQGSYFPVAPVAGSPHGLTSNLSPPAVSHASASAPRTPVFAHTPKSVPEIQHPTPRSHRHNLSAALQKEIDEAEAALAKQDQEGELGKDPLAQAKEEARTVKHEDDHEDLPILKRPETMGGADDQSDIVTNPSLAGTPALVRDINPFNNWQALSDAARGDKAQAENDHTLKTSQPKFNVEAKPFDPSAGFNSSNFDFGGTNAFKPFTGSFKTTASTFKLGAARTVKPSVSALNVEAPAFVPGGVPKKADPLTKATVSQHSPFAFSSATFDVESPLSNDTKSPPSSVTKPSPLTFSSASFNVDAPVFNPSSGLAKSLPTGSTSTDEKPIQSSIFGKVNIEPGTQAVRRAKALPIVRPRSKDGPQGPISSASGESASEGGVGSESDASDGRAPIPTDRAKRARTFGSDGDRSPVYADSAPFTGNSRILSEIISERQPSPEKPKEKPVDGYSYIPAESRSVSAAGSPASPHRRIISGRGSPFQFKDERDAIKFSEARPRSELFQGSDVEVGPSNMDLSSPARDVSPAPQHKSRSSLSALAQPFVYKSAKVADAPVSSMTPEKAVESPVSGSNPSKGKGLMASRFAKSPSPELPSSPPPASNDFAPSPPMSDRPLPALVNENVSRDTKLSQSVDDTATSEIDEPVRDYSAKHSATDSQPVQSEPNVSDGSPVVALQHDRIASLASSRYAPQNAHDLSISSSRYGPQYDSASLASPAYVPGRKELPKVEFSDDGDDLMPSFEEIDAVMKQFESNPELGIERNDSPVESTPLVDMRLGNNFRSDAPSPSPRRIERPVEPTQAANAASFGLGLGIHKLNSGKEEVSDWNDVLSSVEEEKLQSRAQYFDGHVNDLVDGILENRLGPVERTLQTIQHSLSLLATRPTSKRKSTSSDVRESDADDEDEYNAYEGFSTYRSRSPDTKRIRQASRVRAAVAEGLAQFRESMPQPVAPTVDLSGIREELAEMRELAQERAENDHAQLQEELAELRSMLAKSANHVQQKDLKRTLEDVIGSHPRLRGSRTEQDHGSKRENFKLQLDGLEAMLKVEQERAEHEAKLRKQQEDELHEVRQKLQEAEDEVIVHRESSEMAEQNLQAFVQEKEAYKASEREVERLNLMIDEQEENLNEYRRYKQEREADMERLRNESNDLSDSLHDARTKIKDLSYDLEDERSKVRDLTADLDEETAKSKELTRTLWNLKDQLEERNRTSQALHSKTEQLRNEIASTVRDLSTEQAAWRQREHELLTKITMIEGALDSASRSQQKAEVDHDYVSKQLKDALAYKDRFEHLQQDMFKLQEELFATRTASTQHEDRAYGLERELHHAKESKEADIATATARLQAEADGARSQLEGHKSDSEARISRLQARLDTAEIDLEDHKAKYDAALADAAEARKLALQEQAEKHQAALEEQSAGHDRHLGDLRERHTRAMHNSSDDRHRMEHHYGEKVALSEDKIQHLEGKITDLEERLSISKSAAQAAVSAAMARGANLPTPANSVVASPPQRATSASLSLMKGTDLPEKISVQSLRETIITLQEQLHESDQEKERLQAELGKVDKDAPEKIKAYETEALWLRELLGVRIDEMEEIVQSLSKPEFDREAVRDAAIRLKTHIQMEQQIRERAARNAGPAAAASLPSLSDIMGYAQSPRSVLPMVGQAAWGNLRKARDVSINAFGQLAGDYTATPSKAGRAVSPAASYSSGPMTPPNTVQTSRRLSSNSDRPPPAMRPLAAAAAARRMNTPSAKPSGTAIEARPLRAFSSQPRALRVRPESLDGKDPLADLSENASPQTPTLSKGREDLDLGADVDDDASPLDAKGDLLPPFDDIAPKPMET